MATDPDTTDTLSVQLNDVNLSIASGTQADADNMRTLIYVDGEVMAYENATLTRPGQYDFTNYMRRGQYGTPVAFHAAGSSWARIDGDLFRVPYDPGMIGQSIFFKFPSFNIYGGGRESLDAIPAYSYSLAALNAGQLIPNQAAIIGRGCTIVGNKVFRSATFTGLWDADAYSVQGFSQGCAMSFKTSQANAELMVGLSTNPSLDSSYTSINYAWYCRSSGTLSIYELGAEIVVSAGSYTNATVLGIQHDGSLINYTLDGTVVRTALAAGLTLFMDSSFLTGGGGIFGLTFGPAGLATPSPYIARGNCVVSDLNAQKVGGVADWDSDVFSINGYPICHVSWKANQTTANLMIALARNPAENSSYLTLDYAVYCEIGGTIAIYESGTQIGLFGTYDVTTVFGITYDGATITYLANSTVLRTVSVSGLTLYMDSSFFTPGGGVNSLRFGPTTNLAVVDTPQLGANAATDLFFITDDSTITVGFAAPTLGHGFVPAIPVVSSPALTFTASASEELIVTAMTNFFLTNTSPSTVTAQAYVLVTVIDNTAVVVVDYSPKAGPGRSFNNVNYGVSTATTPTQQLAYHMEVGVIAGHSYSIHLLCQTRASQLTANFTSTQIQAEVIKR